MAKDHQRVLRCEMSYAGAPLQFRGNAGVAAVVRQVSDTYDLQATVFDAPDFRLLRSGVVLAHRVMRSTGDWYLACPSWAPMLPREYTEPMGSADLPLELLDRLVPLWRRAPLGPVAGLDCQRQTYQLRDEDGTVLARVRDDQVTVRRGGLTTARYREVKLVSDRATDEQFAALERLLTASGAIVVTRFPSLQQRIGAPATGLSDVPPPVRVSQDETVEQLAVGVVGHRLRQLVRGDLAFRAEAADSEELVRTLADTREELAGFSAWWEPRWWSELRTDLDQLLATEQPWRTALYASVLDRLVLASRAPALGDGGARAADEAVRERLRQQAAAVLALGDSLAAAPQAGSTDAWRALLTATEELGSVIELVWWLEPKLARRLRRSVRRLAALAEPAADPLARPDFAGLTVEDAFDAGRDYEAHRRERAVARRRFAKRWPKLRAKVTGQVKPRGKR
ncbi:CYTH domain-containing protein [Parenemella sanctibonifatiensis]|uniref:CHAD domain-containing protein n=1 Tax=Parenemella sanctibonifatiensis TaxID=2016505 RepID=A0A255DZE8_9ACTN|nr:hypothetical protein [Parenemella sanctibonifatiensis]OYN84616.1 hypothetical protein CGZ92_12325 [Parenemella sanctibonifatiensis]